MIKKIVQQIFKIIVSLTITFGVCWLLTIFADYIALHYLIKKNIVRWSLYTGFADVFFLIFSFSISFFIMNSKIKKLKLYHIVCFICLYLFLDFALDIFEDYKSAYWATSADESYSFSMFKQQFLHRLDVVHYVKKNFATFIVYEFACFIAIICISILSLKSNNWLNKNYFFKQKI